jgi:hypothetical protein
MVLGTVSTRNTDPHPQSVISGDSRKTKRRVARFLWAMSAQMQYQRLAVRVQSERKYMCVCAFQVSICLLGNPNPLTYPLHHICDLFLVTSCQLRLLQPPTFPPLSINLSLSFNKQKGMADVTIENPAAPAAENGAAGGDSDKKLRAMRQGRIPRSN